MASDPTYGICELTVRVTAPGKFAYEVRGDRIGKYNLLGIMQLIQHEIVTDVYSGVRRSRQDQTNHDKTAQNGAKIEIEREQDYTDGVSMPKHEAIRTYYEHMEKMRNRILAIDQAADDETFIVPDDLLRQL